VQIKEKDKSGAKLYGDEGEASWSLGATIGWGLFITAVFILLKGLVLMGFAAVDVAHNANVSLYTMVKKTCRWMDSL
jgi:hypothetical protein